MQPNLASAAFLLIIPPEINVSEFFFSGKLIAGGICSGLATRYKYGSKTLKAGTEYTESGATKKNSGKYIVIITKFQKNKNNICRRIKRICYII